LVSVIIPVRDRVHTLGETLASLQVQTEMNWECLVVDDHSSDGLEEMMRGFRTDERISYWRLEGTGGANAARNLGMIKSRGEFLLFLDSDDALGPKCLEQRNRILQANPELDFGVFPTLLFRETAGDTKILWNVQTAESDLDRFLFLDIPWQTGGVLWRRSGLKKIGEWREGLPSWQDWEMHLRALIEGLRYEWLGTPDSYWRMPRSDSLWNQTKEATHLEARLELLDAIRESLQRAGKLGPRQKDLLAGLYFWHARAWYSKRRRGRAIGAWARAWWHQLVSGRRFLEGCRWFSGWMRGRSDKVPVVFPHWPKEYETGISITFQKRLLSEITRQ
jgi:glycosyltransferase involved in cell wall biosynthesis